MSVSVCVGGVCVWVGVCVWGMGGEWVGVKKDLPLSSGAPECSSFLLVGVRHDDHHWKTWSCHREEWPWPDNLLVFEFHDLGSPCGLHDPQYQVQVQRLEQSHHLEIK